jgi:phosphatidylglycerophosphate synthase
MEQRTYSDPIRLQSSVLSAAEKRLLVAMAERLPRRVSSDQLTLLALLAMVGAGASYWYASVHPVGLLLATLCLAVNWFGDSLDGTLARVRNAQRPKYGFYVDHVVDALGTACLLGGLGLSGYMTPTIALLLLVTYTMVTVEVYLATVVLRTFRMSFLAIGPTELRVILAVGNTWLIFDPAVIVAGRSWLLFDVAGVIAAVGLFVTFLVSAGSNARTLYRAEALPGARR